MHYAWSALAAEDTPWGQKRGASMALDVVAFLRVRDGKIVEIEEFLVPAGSGPA
jgi:ketosteroid isomerase-like protein